MKALLMYRDHDFALQHETAPTEQALVQDLELNTLLNAMALGDPFVWEVAKTALLLGLSADLGTILYRQEILRDSLKNACVVRDLYNITIEALAGEKKIYLGVLQYPSSILRRSIEVLQLFVRILRKLRDIASDLRDQFESEGFTRFFAMLNDELSDEYFETVQTHLNELKFPGGVLVSAELGKGSKGTNYILRKQDKKRHWTERVLGIQPRSYTLHIGEHDSQGAAALAELKGRGINLAANSLAQSTDHILSFFTMLRTELAFYVGCLNLHEQLVQLGEPTCFPLPVPPGEHRHSFEGLYDVCLTLTVRQKIVGNDLQADHQDLVIITGANQGGKSTFLRSIGLSQLMMQCGMFVAADGLCSSLCDGLFTHFRREEDASMTSGKLDEELSRLNVIVDHLTPNSMLLLNESLAATNEREGSEIAGQIVRALLESRIKVIFVTHLYEFAHGLFDRRLKNVLFLRAERRNDGGRTFRIIEGEPLPTSFGKDLFSRVFETDRKKQTVLGG